MSKFNRSGDRTLTELEMNNAAGVKTHRYQAGAFVGNTAAACLSVAQCLASLPDYA